MLSGHHASLMQGVWCPIAQTTQHRWHRWKKQQQKKTRANPDSGNFSITTTMTNQERICPPIPSFLQESTLVSLTDAHPLLVAIFAAVDAEVLLHSPSSKDSPMTGF